MSMSVILILSMSFALKLMAIIIMDLNDGCYIMLMFILYFGYIFKWR